MNWQYHQPEFEYEKVFNDLEWPWAGHKYFAYDLVCHNRPSLIVELGTHRGTSFFSFCQAVKDQELNTKLFAVDTWKGDPHALYYGEEVFTEVSGIRESFYPGLDIGLLRMTFDEAIERFADGTIGLLHIDGFHTYGAVKHDFDSWIGKVADNGVILLHDISETHDDFGVYRLWEELKQEYTTLEFHHSHGLGIVFKKNDGPGDAGLLIEAWRHYYSLFHEKRRVTEILAKKDGEIAAVQVILNQKENELSALYQSIGEKEALLSGQMEVIADMKQSASWRITRPLRWAGARFIPFLRLVRTGLYLLKTEGLWSFLKNTGHYLRKGFHTLMSGNAGQAGRATEIATVPSGRRPIPGHSAEVDIIVCVHNALNDVKRCLSSLIRHTGPPYSLILVDDGSGAETRDYLAAFSHAQGALLLRNEAPTGYTRAANQGMKASTAPWLLLLNSDTVIGTKDWLDRMILCAVNDKDTGIVSALSNTASWQSVPEVFHGDDWAENGLPGDITLEQLATAIARDSAGIYPKVPFLNGFCLLVKKECIQSTGYFDEEAFPDGYGEENDFCIRAAKLGWKLAIADDVYIWHSQSKSYSHETRSKLTVRGGVALEKKHGFRIVEEGVPRCRHSLVLHGIRARVAQYPGIIRIQSECRERYGGKKLLFVLPIAAIGGGANVIIQELLAMRQMRVDCYLANLKAYRESFEKAYPGLDIPVIWLESPQSLREHAGYFDAVIGTAFQSVEWIRNALPYGNSRIIPAYYIQDFEPWFFPEGSTLRKQALESYSLIPQAKYFTKTTWNRDEVHKATGVIPAVVSPSLNLSVFRPLTEKNFHGTLGIAAMIRPETPRRSPDLTMDVLKNLKESHKEKVEIVTFGCVSGEPIIRNFKKRFEFTNMGLLSPEELAILFNRVHLFIDMSSFQAMGLTGMEAMGCGCAAILPVNGGAGSFIRNGHNGFLVDTSDGKGCLGIVASLAKDRNLLQKIAWNAIADSCSHSPFIVAKNILDHLFKRP
jgi:GT2 family glycosyltransferase